MPSIDYPPAGLKIMTATGLITSSWQDVKKDLAAILGMVTALLMTVVMMRLGMCFLHRSPSYMVPSDLRGL